LIRQFVEEITTTLSMPNGRRVGTAGHDVAKKYLHDLMNQLGLTPFRDQQSLELPFRREGQEFCNLVGVVRGQNSALPPILVGGHYDSVIDAPCSDDNATAVAVAMAIAKTAREKKLRRDLVVAIFDSEEPPYFHSEKMGSTRFYQDHCRGFDFAAAIIMDLIGHDVELADRQLQSAFPNIAQLLAIMGCESHPILPKVVQEAADGVTELSILPTLNDYVGDMSDHYAFRLGGVPYLFLSCGQGKYYHTRHDDLAWINFDKVAAVTHLVERLVSGLDRHSTEESHRAVAHDPFEFEIKCIEKAFGPALQYVLQKIGIRAPMQSRRDISQFFSTIQGNLR
jgi:hypothetical protein